MHFSVFAYGAHGITNAAVIIVLTVVLTAEVEVPRVVLARPVDRRRPVETVRANDDQVVAVQVVAPAATRSRKEDGGTIRTGEPSSIYAVLSGPF